MLAFSVKNTYLYSDYADLLQEGYRKFKFYSVDNHFKSFQYLCHAAYSLDVQIVVYAIHFDQYNSYLASISTLRFPYYLLVEVRDILLYDYYERG